RKPAGAAGALLSYLPYAEDESQAEETCKALVLLASQAGKPEPDLLRGLSDERTLVRAAAAQALASGGGMEGRAAARKLLREEAAAGGVRVALALAQARERDSIPVLIDLLTELTAAEVGQAEDALHQLAGETAPKESPGEGAAERKKYRDAWAAWWKINAARADLSRLTNRPWDGYPLHCE